MISLPSNSYVRGVILQTFPHNFFLVFYHQGTNNPGPMSPGPNCPGTKCPGLSSRIRIVKVQSVWAPLNHMKLGPIFGRLDFMLIVHFVGEINYANVSFGGGGGLRKDS